MDKAAADNHSNQMNPNNDSYTAPSGGSNEAPSSTAQGGDSGADKAAADNHSNQGNPNNDAYTSSRGGAK